MANKTRAELEAEIAELKRMIAERDLAAENASTPRPATPAASSVYVNAPSTDVVVVYTSHSMGHMEGSQFSLDAQVYGEEFTLSRQQFDELVGKYRRWFEKGVLAVSYRNADVAAAKDLPIDKDNGLTVKELHSLGKMTPDQIEKLWNKVKLHSLHETMVHYFKDQYLAGTEGFRDVARVDAMNRLTNGGFDSEVQAVRGRAEKLHPTDFVTLDY